MVSIYIFFAFEPDENMQKYVNNCLTVNDHAINRIVNNKCIILQSLMFSLVVSKKCTIYIFTI